MNLGLYFELLKRLLPLKACANSVSYSVPFIHDQERLQDRLDNGPKPTSEKVGLCVIRHRSVICGRSAMICTTSGNSSPW